MTAKQIDDLLLQAFVDAIWHTKVLDLKYTWRYPELVGNFVTDLRRWTIHFANDTVRKWFSSHVCSKHSWNAVGSPSNINHWSWHISVNVDDGMWHMDFEKACNMSKLAILDTFQSESKELDNVKITLGLNEVKEGIEKLENITRLAKHYNEQSDRVIDSLVKVTEELER